VACGVGRRHGQPSITAAATATTTRHSAPEKEPLGTAPAQRLTVCHSEAAAGRIADHRVHMHTVPIRNSFRLTRPMQHIKRRTRSSSESVTLWFSVQALCRRSGMAIYLRRHWQAQTTHTLT
jgi:hypothetical protein